MPYWGVQGRQVCSVWLPLDSIPLESAVEYISGSHNWGQQFEPYHFMDSTPYEGTGLPPLPDIDALRNQQGAQGGVLSLPLPATQPSGSEQQLGSSSEQTTQHQILRWAMEPGDVLVFQGDIVHGYAAALQSIEQPQLYVIGMSLYVLSWRSLLPAVRVDVCADHSAPGHEIGTGRRRALVTRWLGDDARYCVKPGEVAIPTFDDHGLQHGDVMEGEHFPRII
jgi:hypothetical protein